MSDDPHALKLYIDGNCYKNPGGAGAVACVAHFPDDCNRPDEDVFSMGFHETTNNRMELQACIRAFEYVADEGAALGVQRVIIVTDTQYVYDNYQSAASWRADSWRTAAGRPVENSDLWKRFLAVRGKVRIRTDLTWKKGKKSPTLKMVDRAAKAAGRAPSKHDRGFRGGKVARSKVMGGSAPLYVARGGTEVIRIYRSALLRKTGHKVIFDLYDEATGAYKEKRYAYTDEILITELHRQHCFRVRFNSEPRHPLIVAIVEEIPCATLGIAPSLEVLANDESAG